METKQSPESSAFLECLETHPEMAFQVAKLYFCETNAHKKIYKISENIILQDPKYSYRYAEQVIKGRWKKAEPTLAKDIYFSFYYAKNILKKRFKLAENLIATDAEFAYDYATNIIKKRWQKGEESICKNASFSYKYSQFLKSRFRKGEEIISENSEYCFYYAKDIIKGKLPAKMHDKMLGHALNNPEDKFVKYYFEFIKNHT